MTNYWLAIKDDPEKMKSFYDEVIESVEEMKSTNPKAYKKAMLEIHESIFGEHFDEDMALKAVAGMKNVDGTTGEHWTLEQTTSVLKQHDLGYNPYDFYYLMNMLYSDFSNVLGTDVGIYLKMAMAYIDDPDAEEGKVFEIWESRYM